MKYRLKKDLPWAKAGTIVDADFTSSGDGNISYVAQKGEYEGKEVWHGWYPKQYSDWNDWFEEVDERWKPKKGDIVFFVHSTGVVSEIQWNTFPSHKRLYKIFNCFKTKDQAKQAAEQIKALLKEFHKNNP